jgi:ACS family hexuronate transporter-like MFS transporter
MGGKVTWGQVLGYRQTWSFIVAKFLTDPVWWFFLIWLPTTSRRRAGSTSRTAGSTS